MPDLGRLSQEDTQLALLAFALAAVARPGFDYALTELARRLSGAYAPDAQVDMYREFKRLNDGPVSDF